MRGMARAMLGLWEEAARDLGVASTLDHDEEIGSVLKKVLLSHTRTSFCFFVFYLMLFGTVQIILRTCTPTIHAIFMMNMNDIHNE